MGRVEIHPETVWAHWSTTPEKAKKSENPLLPNRGIAHNSRKAAFLSLGVLTVDT